MNINKLAQSPVAPPLPGLAPTAAFAATQVSTGSAKSLASDKIHISIGNQTNGRPAATIRFADVQNPNEFGSAVHVDSPKDKDAQRLFGVLELTSNQKQQIRAAEARAFDRFFHAGNSPERGSIQAKLSQASIETHQPGFLEHSSAMGITPQEKDQIMDALKEYGEELAAIGVSGRNRRELQRYVEDKFFVTIFDRDKEEFEDYFKGGVREFFGDSFGSNSPDNNIVKPAQSSSESVAKLPTGSQDHQEAYRWKFVQPRIGISLKGTDFKEAMIKPKVDLVRLRGPADTEVRLVADVPFNFNGKYEPRGELHARRMLNHKPGEYGGWKDNVYAESHTDFEYNQKQVRTTLGIRKQISPDSSMGLYALYSKTFAGDAPEDLGLGVNYQSRFH
jgi:hypothetical protein